MSRRDLKYVLMALSVLAGAETAVGVAVTAIDEAVGRGRGDMRTPLNLQSLADDGLVTPLPDGTWTLTQEGIDWLREDQQLSDR